MSENIIHLRTISYPNNNHYEYFSFDHQKMSSTNEGNDFQYVLIPAEQSEQIKQLKASKEGGLADDFLVKNAKNYFFERNGGIVREKALDSATPEQKVALAKQLREQYTSSSDERYAKVAEMDDENLLQIVRSSQASATCEISALTVPTQTNEYTAVSMYGDDNARLRDMPFNTRGTDLMRACGYSLPTVADENDGKLPGVYGDVFIGKY